jgi:hypothetical protein
MPGLLENVNITVDNGTPWEINLDGDLAQLPQVVDVSVSFKPILSELPRRYSANKYSTNTATNIDYDTPALIAEPIIKKRDILEARVEPEVPTINTRKQLVEPQSLDKVFEKAISNIKISSQSTSLGIYDN